MTNDDIQMPVSRAVEYIALLCQHRELILAVATKYPGETRHQTALRYIRQAEERANTPAVQSTHDPHFVQDSSLDEGKP